VAAAIIALTITKLSSYTLVIDGDVAVQDGCVMGNSPAFPNMSICTVNYIVAGSGYPRSLPPAPLPASLCAVRPPRGTPPRAHAPAGCARAWAHAARADRAS
jgi:hypothetical protein